MTEKLTSLGFSDDDVNVGLTYFATLCGRSGGNGTDSR
jgi:hypothetical protein